MTKVEQFNYKDYMPKSILWHKLRELEYDQLDNPKNIYEDNIKIAFIRELLEEYKQGQE